MNGTDIEEISIIRLNILMDFSVLYFLLMLNLPIHFNGTHYKTLLCERNCLLTTGLGYLELDHWSGWETLGFR